MTQDAIVAKLASTLRAGITEECQVVYVLAQLRKLLERLPRAQEEDYPALDFYCSWCLHTEMDRAGAKRILSAFDEAYPILAKGEQLPEDLRTEIDRIAALREFTTEMERFLVANRLPTIHGLARFLRLYGQVIEDCDLVVRDNRVQLEHLDRISIRLEIAKTPVYEDERLREVLYALTWTCHAKDGKSGEHTVYFSYSEDK